MNFGARDRGTAVSLEPGKIMVAGGYDTATAEIIDFSDPNPAWEFTGSMNTTRRHHRGTLLPDGKVLVTGGLTGHAQGDPVLEAEMFDPDTGAWEPMASMQKVSQNHGTAFLLPDARVAVGGSSDKTIEIYSPPYLFTAGGGPAPRPTILEASDPIKYANSFTVRTRDASSIASVALIGPSAVTHWFDQNQRYIELSFTAVSADTLDVQGPANANLAPPGYHMLFILDGQGVPSKARFIRLIACSVGSECDDANECTTDACVTESCQNTPVADGTSCAGGICCDGACTSGSCAPGPPTCKSKGESCSKPGECCSGKCTGKAKTCK